MLKTVFTIHKDRNVIDCCILNQYFADTTNGFSDLLISTLPETITTCDKNPENMQV